MRGEHKRKQNYHRRDDMKQSEIFYIAEEIPPDITVREDNA
jgi:hypothetical protein